MLIIVDQTTNLISPLSSYHLTNQKHACSSLFKFTQLLFKRAWDCELGIVDFGPAVRFG